MCIYVYKHTHIHIKMNASPTFVGWPFPYKYEDIQDLQSSINSNSDRRPPSFKYGSCTGTSGMTEVYEKKHGRQMLILLGHLAWQVFFGGGDIIHIIKNSSF